MLCLEMKIKFTLKEVEDISLRFFFLQEKRQIWRFSEKRHFYSLGTLSFYLEHQQTLFLGLLDQKPTPVKFQSWTKPMAALTNSLGKVTNLATLGKRLFAKALD